MLRTLEAFEHLPVNVGLQPSARTSVPGQLEAAIEAGAVGLKIHEDWGASPEVIDEVLRVADAHDVQVCLHTDGLNESCELPETVEAIASRAIHAYHVEGSGGGHVPDLIGIVREPNVFCSSTTPTIPYGPSTAAEQPDMKLIVHEGNPALPGDLAAARELVHPATMEAEGPLHDLGAISIVNSDSQGMGRIGETVRRTFQLAHAMKAGHATETRDDNERVLRYLAKMTEEPARVHGISDEVGSLTPGRLADLVLWEASSFGVKPLVVIKGGVVAWTAIGEGNASAQGAQPTRYGEDWGGIGIAAASVSVTFVSAAALDAGISGTLGTRRRLVPVRGTRSLRRDGLARNRTVPAIDVSPVDGTVTLDGRVLRIDPVTAVPLSRRHLLA
jgi:urease subunit alpha